MAKLYQYNPIKYQTPREYAEVAEIVSLILRLLVVVKRLEEQWNFMNFSLEQYL